MGWLRRLVKCFTATSRKSSTVGKVPEQYLKPQGLYASSDRIDLKKLRKLIVDGRLVPCYPGLEDNAASCDEVEECPICFLGYPVLNTSRCCQKRLCTECFLQVQATASREGPPSCPFCKTPSYTATFCGQRTEESKNEEKLAEQNVLEARIREREEEVVRDQERALARATQQALAPSSAAAAANTSFVTSVTPGRSPARSRAHSSATTPPSSSHSATGSGIPRRRTGSIGSAGEGAVGRPAAAAAVTAAAGQAGGRSSPARDAGVGSRGAASARASEMQPPALSDVPVDGPAVQSSASRRRYRLADYIPTGVVDIAVSVEDINAYMVS
ncbi:MAG: hypothetical protein WDW38_010671 [Sanguina aurantia]